MEIKDFVKKTLLEISSAIDETNDEFGSARRFQLAAVDKNQGLIEFDLAVEAKRTGTKKAGGGLKVAVLEANAGGEKNYSEGSVSRIKFIIMDNH